MFFRSENLHLIMSLSCRSGACCNVSIFCPLLPCPSFSKGADWLAYTGEFEFDSGASCESVKKLGNAKLNANQRQEMQKFNMKLSQDEVMSI